MRIWLACLFFFLVQDLRAKIVELDLDLGYSHKNHREEVSTILRTRLGELFFIDRKEYRAELQAEEHPSKIDTIVIKGKVYKIGRRGGELLVSRPKMTIPLGKSKRFTVEDRLRRKLFVKVSPVKTRN